MARCDWWILVRLCLINFVIGGLFFGVCSFAKRGEEEGSANFERLGGTCCTFKLYLCFVNLISVNVMIMGAFANKRGRRVPQTLKDSAACVANVAS